MEYLSLREYEIALNNVMETETVNSFLMENGLMLDKDVEYTMVLLDGKELVATGSFSGRVLKCIAVDKNYQGLGITNKVVSHLVSEEYQRGNTHLFIYTKPENYSTFQELGFYRIAEVPHLVTLLENHPEGINNYIKEIQKQKKEGTRVSSIVMNCNPFTLGHQYLIEKASLESDIVHIFIVWEEKSSFPAEIRYHLVTQGTKHIQNVVVHKGGDYIISSATFPSYFIKEYQDVVRTHALLDLEVFSKHIAPALGITKRFIGEEPYCKVTEAYNRVMKEVLRPKGIEVIEVPRLCIEGNAVSASFVRSCLREGDICKIKKYVPKSTYDFLLSKEGKKIIKSLQGKNSRH